MRNKLAQKSNHFVNILLKRVTYQKIEKHGTLFLTLCQHFVIKNNLAKKERKNYIKREKRKKGEKEWNWMKLSPSVGA